MDMTDRHDTDVLFKALADPSRRKLLDLLRAREGRTLGQLCEHLHMTRRASRSTCAYWGRRVRPGGERVCRGLRSPALDRAARDV